MAITVGSAPDSWGIWFPSEPRQTPWNRCLDEIAAAGYEWTELGPYGYLPTDPKVLRQEMDRRGLKVTGSFIQAHLDRPEEAWLVIEKQLRGWGPIFNELGAKFLVLIDETYTNLFTGEPLASPRLDAASFQRLIDTTHRLARVAKEDYGLQLAFHPHAETHVEYADQMEAFLERTDPDLVFGARYWPLRLSARRQRRLHAQAPQAHPVSPPEERRSADARPRGCRENSVCQGRLDGHVRGAGKGRSRFP